MPLAIAVLLLAQLADILSTYYAITTHPSVFTEGNPMQLWFGWEGVGVIKVGVTMLFFVLLLRLIQAEKRVRVVWYAIYFNMLPVLWNTFLLKLVM